jgi:hypothetical protein
VVVAATSGLREQADINKVLAWSKKADVSFKDNLVGSWNMDKASAIHNSIIFDSSGQGNHGTLYTSDGSTNKAVTGMVNNALSFDGADDYLEILHNTSLEPASISVGAWVKLNSDSTRHIILAKWTGYTLEVDSGGNSSFQIYNSQGQVGVGASAAITWGKWHYLTATFNDASKVIEIYINGVKKGTNTLSSSISYGHSVLRISNTIYGGGAVNGSIDEVRIYDTALTFSQIQSQYYAGLNKLLVRGLIGEEEYQRRLRLN